MLRPWVEPQNGVTQELAVEVGVEFGGGNRLVAQHFLNGFQIGAAFNKVRGERVAEGVGADGLFQTDFGGKVFNNGEDHYTRQFAAATVQEQNVLVFAVDFQRLAIIVDVERD